MKFEKKADSKKLAIKPENRMEEAWLTTCRHQTVKPGDEKYVIRAYTTWRREGHDPETVIRQAATTTAAAIQDALTGGSASCSQPGQAEAHEARLANGELIAEATQLWQRLFRESPVFDMQGNHCTLWSNACSRDFDGYGENPKAAKAAAAQEFLDCYGGD